MQSERNLSIAGMYMYIRQQEHDVPSQEDSLSVELNARAICFIVKSTFFNRKSGFLNRNSGFFH